MEGGGELRRWDELIPDALGLILRNLSLQEKLTVIPRVCKSWGNAIAGPYCWQEIDIEEWSQCSQPEHLARMIRMLITRSCGSLRKLCVAGIKNDPIFKFIADHAGALQILRVPRSEISNALVEQLANKFSNITFLDLSYCSNIGAPALEAIGKNCKLLVGLQRVMHPLTVADMVGHDDEAHAIATTMPKLKHLEVSYMLLTTQSVLEILSSCRELEYLDMRGCWDVKLDDKFLQEKHSGLKVMGPLIVDCYGRNNWEDDFSDDSDSSGYLAWDFIAGQAADYYEESSDGAWDDERRLEELELSFYEGFEHSVDYAFYEGFEHSVDYEWPPFM